MTDEERGAGAEREPFLSRWSRLKQEAKAPPEPAPSAPLPVEKADAAPPELPPLEKLTPESDYRGFFHPKVDENLRRAALKKLFTDPHFNVMDGLDVYIDDYSRSDPLPAAMLAQLKHAQKILDWAREKPGGAEPSGATETEQPLAAADGKRIGAPEPSAFDLPAAATGSGDGPAEAPPPRPAV